MLRWRSMQEDDLSGVMGLARIAHPDLYEAKEVFAERRLLFPRGCLVLAFNATIQGYAFSHPIRQHQPPALNSMQSRLPDDADCYYVHDFVIAPAHRGSGYATSGLTHILEIAKAFPTTSLIAVYGTTSFWARFGFEPAPQSASCDCASYGDNVIYMLRKN